MSQEVYAYNVWLCSKDNQECVPGGRADNFDLVCETCGTAYVITSTHHAAPAGD